MLWVRSLDTEEARPLAGTENAEPRLFWSPDSRFLAFVSGGKLKKIEATGGPAQTLCDDPTHMAGGVWTSDNRILFGTLGPVQVVSAAGGTPTPLTTLDHSRNELAHAGPSMLPDGHHFLYLRLSIPFENGGVYIGSLDAKPEQQSTRKLLPDTTNAVYVPSPLTGDAPGLSAVRARRHAVIPNQRHVDGAALRSQADGTSPAMPCPSPSRSASFSASPTGVLAFCDGRSPGQQSTHLV